MIRLFRIRLIETLRSNLELQVLHSLIDMILTFEDCEVKVVECVITFLVIYVEREVI